MKLKREPYLIQRLDIPYKTEGEGKLAGLAGAFSFGGGLKNGGISDEAMDLIKPIFSFDYMGSAEFEFGAVPKSLEYIAKKHDDYKAFTYDGVEKPIYVICFDDEELSDDICTHIKKYAKEPHGHRTKEMVGLYGAINDKGHIRRTKGWLDIDNHFFFFIDEDMFKQTSKLFGIEVSE